MKRALIIACDIAVPLGVCIYWLVGFKYGPSDVLDVLGIGFTRSEYELALYWGFPTLVLMGLMSLQVYFCGDVFRIDAPRPTKFCPFDGARYAERHKKCRRHEYGVELRPLQWEDMKFCPVDGARYAAQLGKCPKHDVELRPLQEDR